MHYRIDLYFGIRDQRQWSDFLRAHIAKFLNVTVQQGIGYWSGIEESQATVSLVVPESELVFKLGVSKALAVEYCRGTGETCVLVTVSPVSDASLVSVEWPQGKLL